MASKPKPFRADHIGSLGRPAELRQARERFIKHEIGLDDIHGLEDKWIRERIAMQERVGLQVITDGEFRRTSFRQIFFDKVAGFSQDRVPSDFEFTLADGRKRRASPVPRVADRLSRCAPIAVDEFKFIRATTNRTPKVTLPAPSLVHWFIGDAVLRDGPYRTAEELMVDLSAIYREELAELGKAGCSYVQIDEVAIPIMLDPQIQDHVRQRGEDHVALTDLYVKAINDAIRDRPDHMQIYLHMCRGNDGHGIGAGGYEPIAEQVFGKLNVDGYLLEYDTPRAGDFAVLRHIPRDAIVVLGLMSTKTTDVESVEFLQRRIDDATQHIDLERLCISPQCGFASAYFIERLTMDDEERKLARLVETADRVWL